MSVKIKGVPALKENIARFFKGISEFDAEALDEGANLIIKDAKALCPVGTPASTGIRGYIGGSLRKSIRKEKTVSRTKNVQAINVRVGGYVRNPNTGKLVDYHILVHEGTSKMPGRPFLAMAYEKNELAILDAHAKLVRRRLF